LLIASGAGKAAALRGVLAGEAQYPACRLKVDGELILLADAAALAGDGSYARIPPGWPE